MTKKITAGRVFLYILIAIMIIIAIFPLVYLVVQSLAPVKETNLKLIPSYLTGVNYITLFTSAGTSTAFTWVRALLNSFIVCIITTIVSVMVGLFTGYSQTKLKGFRGRKFIKDTLLFQMFFPVVMLLVPRYMLLRNLSNTYIGMLLPMIISTWAIFMYVNYFNTLPDSVFEAAKIDGANVLQTIHYIALPSTKSITTIVALTVFMGRWNELMWDMVISPKEQYQTLNVLLSTKMNMLTQQQGVLYSASVLLIVPIVVLFLMFSKYFREGINFMLK
ncbi:MAG: carbohydrate ABC transporter permease [Lachnospiraceae bacterium]|jgi:multiple sugar transport system permease protein|nr:carbohydrate ABC transporter permease [Lachnospiraceae bacterium]MCH4069998.1 carbohydrate ABC transporter permease [Lachnospiraceae bacterium]MCH4108648.1 carbohydrate ABC transporter permease [Lachnospiraceae bacterium]MCI1302800.1 carbohydrate ABC transporter permease [Lachnospiraceae bacterium]MCI1332063.1 carbohydrate ABC transporter permease [Lachnospiraceae bacterium]